MQSALDRIWRAPVPDKSGGLWGVIRSRFLSFGMVLGIGFLLIASLVASAALAAFGRWWAPLFGGWELLAQVANFVVSFGLITAAFALIYKYMPRVHIAWRDVWVGAAVTALLFTIGKFAIGLYIGKTDVASAYGAAGALAVLLIWVYYSAQIFLMGAEFTWVYAHAHGSRKGAPQAEADEAPKRSQREPGSAQFAPGAVLAPAAARPRPAVSQSRANPSRVYPMAAIARLAWFGIAIFYALKVDSRPGRKARV